jgi:hypothetical protein
MQKRERKRSKEKRTLKISASSRDDVKRMKREAE